MPDLTQLARWLIVFGLSLTAIGGLVWVVGRTGLPLGRLPGDLRFESGGFTCVIPLATSIVLSLILTVALNIILRWLSK
ncbi:MAG: DUF2905 domain-containing protein [Chloroflexota bacterium]